MLSVQPSAGGNAFAPLWRVQLQPLVLHLFMRADGLPVQWKWLSWAPGATPCPGQTARFRPSMACLGRAMPCCRASNEGRSASLYVPFGVAISAICQSDTAGSAEFRSPYGFPVSVWPSVDEAFFCMFYLQNTVAPSARRHGLSSPGACPAYGHGRKNMGLQARSLAIFV